MAADRGQGVRDSLLESRGQSPLGKPPCGSPEGGALWLGSFFSLTIDEKDLGFGHGHMEAFL
ncbi:MAG: hypothetical protein LBJ13_03950 [Puniceicoccales bacterium]|nr:hypothetical protein [Puniceicoccales bacterium]